MGEQCSNSGSGNQCRAVSSPAAALYDTCDSRFVWVDDFSTLAGLVVATGTDGVTFPTAITAYNAYPLNAVANGVPFNRIQLWPNAYFAPGGNGPAVQVTARWGWAAVPAEVKQATLIQVANVFSRKFSTNGIAGQGDFLFRVSKLPLDPTAEALVAARRLVAAVIA